VGSPVHIEDPELPLVSVVIPSYNSAATLAETLDSVLGQTYPRLEVIVVDDGSTDATPDVLARYAPRVRGIRQRNGGLAAARNTGCAAAGGEFIALLDADDLCTPERIGAQVLAMAARPDVVLSGTEFSSFDENGVQAERLARQYYSWLGSAERGLASFFDQPGDIDIARWMPEATAGPVAMPLHSGDVYRHLVLGNFIHPPTVMFRRAVLAQAGMFDETIRNCCDWEWLVRVSRAGKFAFLDRPLLRYRRSMGQMSGPRHRVQLYADIVTNLQKFAIDDPQVPVWGGRRYRRALGAASVNLASALVETDRRRALGLLYEALVHGAVDRDWWRYLVKALVPQRVVDGIRARRRAAAPLGARQD
jgi:glycosyltransferase involved in cell wall biosynthesis